MTRKYSKREMHGMTGTSIYECWKSIKQRCLNNNCRHYINYGGRGITICDEGKDSFEKFYSDMGDVPDGKSIERIDNDIGYSKENCGWATQSEQLLNRRLSERNKTGVRGVLLRDDCSGFLVQLVVFGKNRHLGRFKDLKEAEICYVQHYYGHHGKYPPEYKGIFNG